MFLILLRYHVLPAQSDNTSTGHCGAGPDVSPTIVRVRQEEQILDDLDQRAQLSVLLRRFQPPHQLPQPLLQLLLVHHALLLLLEMLPSSWRLGRGAEESRRHRSDRRLRAAEAEEALLISITSRYCTLLHVTARYCSRWSSNTQLHRAAVPAGEVVCVAKFRFRRWHHRPLSECPASETQSVPLW